MPSLAMSSGSMPSSSAAARTAGADRQRRLVEDDADARTCSAISCSALATPPRVGSFIATTPSPAARARARISPFIGATSDCSVLAELELVARRHHRHAVIADRAGDDEHVAGLQRRCRGSTRAAGRRRSC